MDPKLEPLILNLLEWMSARPRSHSEVMATWKTSCPQLTVWEDAQEAGLVDAHHKAGGLVWFEMSGIGRKFLEERRPASTATPQAKDDSDSPDGKRAKSHSDSTQVPVANRPFLISRELFRTDRLVVRHLDYPDYDDFYAVYSDPAAMRWVDDGTPIQAEDCFRWIEITHKNYAARGYGMSALVLQETGDIVGFCGLVHPGGQEDVEIKYALKRSVWGQGLATEAVRGMLEYARREFGVERVIATVAPENSASTNVLAKAGMFETDRIMEEDGAETAVYTWSLSP